MKTLYKLNSLNLDLTNIINILIHSDRESHLKKLYTIIQSGNEIDDHEAMQLIFHAKNNAAFSKLKARLKEILIRATSLQTVKFESSDSRINEVHNQFRAVLVAKLLKDLKEENLAIEIAEKALIKSMKFHATEIVLIILRMLIKHFGAAEYNRYKLSKYLQLQQKYLHQHSWEIKSENYYYDLQRIQLQSLAAPSEFTIVKALNYLKELESVKDVNSLNFNLNLYKIKSIIFEYKRDYNSLLRLADDTFKQLNSDDLKSGTITQNIYIRKAWAFIQAGRNKDAITIGKNEIKRLPSGSSGWFFIAHYTLKAYLYSGDYKKAIELVIIIIENNRFRKIPKNLQELFNTTLSYIHLICDSELFVQLKSYKKSLPEFKLYKFLNTIPVFSKDKRGINVSILLMHIAFLLQRKDYNAIIDRVDSLNQYAYRYLRKDDSFRSNCMIKMVIQMTKADFHPVRTERYTRDLLKQLEQVKLAGSGENIETEIIPYEVLWKIMTKAL